MKSKLTWITFVPLCLAACFCKAIQFILPEGSVLGLSNLMLDYFFIAAVVLIFLFAVLFCVVDKRISPYYLPHRNIPAGLIGIVLAVALAGDGAINIYNIIGKDSMDVLQLIESILLLLSAIAFVTLGLTHSFRGGEHKRFALFNLFPALLFGIRMVVCFVSFTTISIRLADVPALVCYIFATMFFFNYAVALSLVQAKHAVKSCFIFGFPAVAALIPYGAVKLIFSFDAQTLENNLTGVEAVLTGLYILCFLIELTAFVKDRDSVEIIDDSEIEEYGDRVDEEDDQPVSGEFITGSKVAEQEAESSYLTTADTSDYVYKETHEARMDRRSAYAEASKDAENYITELVDEDTETPDKPRNYESRLDEIDKLILEISEQSD